MSLCTNFAPQVETTSTDGTGQNTGCRHAVCCWCLIRVFMTMTLTSMLNICQMCYISDQTHDTRELCIYSCRCYVRWPGKLNKLQFNKIHANRRNTVKLRKLDIKGAAFRKRIQIQNMLQIARRKCPIRASLNIYIYKYL